MKPEPSLSTTVASVPLETCIYNASGPRSGTSAALSKVASSASGAILAKSATRFKQDGNPLPRTWHQSKIADKSIASLNSEGLPNSGIEYYIAESTISQSVGDSGKPYFVSISGKSLEDNLIMMGMIAAAFDSGINIAAVELNLACPNVIGKPIIGYDFDQFERVLLTFTSLPCFAKNAIPFGIKLPPYFDFSHYARAAKLINEKKEYIKFVSTINTLGNAYAVDVHSESPVISSNSGFAGLSGKAVKYVALANVKKMRELLDDDIDVVGVGGVSTGEDAFEMILAGASAVQVGTCHWVEGPACFDRIADELRGIMKEKGYTCLDDFKGKMKDWSKEGASLSRKKKKSLEGGEVEEQVGKVTKEKESEDFFMYISAVLLVLLSALLADKYVAPFL